MAILATERVLTLDFWKPAHKLVVGDYVFDKNGDIVKITSIQEYRAPHCYRVILDDHLSIAGDKNLAFMTENTKYRIRLITYKGVQQFRRPLRKVDAQTLLEIPLVNKNGSKIYSIPTTGAIKLPHQDLPVPPFVFGFWFFGRASSKIFTAQHGTYDYLEAKFKDHGYKLTKLYSLPKNRQRFTISPSIDLQLAPNIPTTIPNNYLYASFEQRLELLSGIFYSKRNKYDKKRDTFAYKSTHYPTITMLQGLAESLGCRTRIKKTSTSDYYELFFKCRHKLVEYQNSPSIKVHQARRYITEIEEIADQSCIHIETSGKDNTILVGEGFIPTC